MSGTSLDGLDFCCANYFKKGNEFSYEIETAHTFKYPEEWVEKLSNAHLLPSLHLLQLHEEYGEFIGKKITEFIQQKNIWNVDFVASHGHTIFHEPRHKITFQLGHGAAIFYTSQCKTICDFRSEDVIKGGQGAPLVPVGDELLFNEYDACLNLGGFANISFRENGKRVAFDICPVNYPLNFYARQLGKDFDENGNFAKSGEVNSELLNRLNALDFYAQKHPKSLGREWVEENIYPLLKDANISTQNIISTFTEHIAIQITNVLNTYNLQSVLVTGGGTYNHFLLDRIKHYSNSDLVIPNAQLIDFKEALIFGFLGYLKLLNIDNIYSSVTGAKHDSKSGIIYSH